MGALVGWIVIGVLIAVGYALELLIVAAILYAVTGGVMPMAAALAGGLTMGVMTVRSLSDTADKATNVAKGAGAAGKGLFKMGKWGYDKLHGGNSVSNAGTSSNGWQPAYRSTVMSNLQKAHSKR